MTTIQFAGIQSAGHIDLATLPSDGSILVLTMDLNMSATPGVVGVAASWTQKAVVTISTPGASGYEAFVIWEGVGPFVAGDPANPYRIHFNAGRGEVNIKASVVEVSA